MSRRAVQVDLSNCEREPIHTPGATQPFGFLMALSADWKIARVSANVGQFIGLEPAALFGRAIGEVFSREAVHAVRGRLAYLPSADVAERLFKLRLLAAADAPCFDIGLHRVGDLVLLEAEPAQSDSISATGLLRSVMARLDHAMAEDDFFREAVRFVRTVTGFDRVMIYRFDQQEAGEIIAESARGDIGSFFGLHYPASDIPVQARALYVRNLFRVIADVAAPAVPLVPADDETALDLSMAMTRAVSPMHIEYLRNMGVAASLSISIVIGGRLWGLFVCHHGQPRLPSLERRSLAELFGQMFAMKLAAREQQQRAEQLKRARTVGDGLLAMLADDMTLLHDPRWLGGMLNRAIESDGMAISLDGRLAHTGLVPAEADCLQLIAHLRDAQPQAVWASDRIADVLPEAAHWPVAGVLSMPISRSARDYVLLFRREQIHTVRWAGNPDKPVERAPEGSRLTPRKSFETWAELVQGRSSPFDAATLQIADTLRARLIEVVLKLSEQMRAERQRAIERQNLLIAELNHRVRNILTLITGLVSRSTITARSVEDYAQEIGSRVGALARAHNQITQHRWGAASLIALLKAEAAAFDPSDSRQVSLEGPEIELLPTAFSTLALVIHELMTNSAKYGALSTQGQVTVRWQLEADGGLTLDWLEAAGPPVQPPRHQGFGSMLIRRAIPHELGGTARVDFKPQGLQVHFSIPARHLPTAAAPADALAAEAAIPSRAVVALPVVTSPSNQPQPLRGHRVLLLEDSLIAAIDTEDALLRLGADGVQLASTVEQALVEIAAVQPTLAVLDMNLGERSSLVVAEHLSRLGVPFVFATGYGDHAALAGRFTEAPLLQKPYRIDQLAGVLAALLQP